MRPRSRDVSLTILFCPISMSGSLTMRLSVFTKVVPPFTVKFPVTDTFPVTTRTLDPISSTYKFEPILNVCDAKELAIPTFPVVTNAVVLL